MPGTAASGDNHQAENRQEENDGRRLGHMDHKKTPFVKQ
jgi:hypothetical protein